MGWDYFNSLVMSVCSGWSLTANQISRGLCCYSPKISLTHGPGWCWRHRWVGVQRPACLPVLTGFSSVLSCPGETDRRSGPEKLPVGGALWSVSLCNFDQTFSKSYSGRQRHAIHGLKSSTKIFFFKKVSTRTSSILWECAVFIPGRPSQE